MTEAPDARAEAVAKGMGVAFWAERQPKRKAIVSPSGERTWAELNQRANQLARALRRRGLTAGDAVALLCANRPEFAEVAAATTRSGLRLTPVNWHLTGGEAGYIVDDCEAKAFVADARFGAAAREAADLAPGAAVRLAVGGSIDGFDNLDDVVSTEDGSDIDDPVLGVGMLYTSGTTGRPKGVHRPPAASVTATLTRYDPERHVHLCTGPLYHAAPLAFSLTSPINAGVTTVLMDGWDPEEMLRLVEAYRVTHTHMVPTMFHRLVSLPDDVKRRYDVSSIMLVLHGAAPCPVPVKQAMIDWWGPVLLEYYAATEGWGSFVTSEEWLKKPGTVGRPNPPETVRILGDDGEEMPSGQIGTVYLRAPAAGRFRYFKDDEKTSGAYRGDYFTLGDVGYVDEDGYLFLTDRSANLIISGGVNIYPAEVDAVLLEHPAVGDAATIGIPHPEWGEEVKAVVEPRAGVEPSDELAADLIAWCRDRLAHYKCPRSVDFTERLPREDNGKIYKRRLRDEYRARAEGVTATNSKPT
jgi:long-chain acyl-CoA synthetase